MGVPCRSLRSIFYRYSTDPLPICFDSFSILLTGSHRCILIIPFKKYLSLQLLLIFNITINVGILHVVMLKKIYSHSKVGTQMCLGNDRSLSTGGLWQIPRLTVGVHRPVLSAAKNIVTYGHFFFSARSTPPHR